MVKFEIIVPPIIAAMLQDRTVCDVCESHQTDSLLGKIVSWRGSVEEEYFSIIFAKGILTVSLVEREYNLGRSAVNFAMSEHLFKVLKESKDNAALRTTAVFDYHMKRSQKEQEEISFIDVMVILEWRYAERAKIYYDPLGW